MKKTHSWQRFLRCALILNLSLSAKRLCQAFYAVQVEGGPILFVAKDGSHFIDGNLYQITRSQFVDIKEFGLN